MFVKYLILENINGSGNEIRKQEKIERIVKSVLILDCELDTIFLYSTQQPQTGLAMANGSSSGASRRESMDRGSSAFSPSLSEQYKNKAAAGTAGWPTSYGALGTGKSFFFLTFP